MHHGWVVSGRQARTPCSTPAPLTGTLTQGRAGRGRARQGGAGQGRAGWGWAGNALMLWRVRSEGPALNGLTARPAAFLLWHAML